MLVGKQVGNGDDFNVGIGGNHVACGSGTPTPASYEPHFYAVVPPHGGEPEFRQRTSRGNQSRARNKIPSFHMQYKNKFILNVLHYRRKTPNCQRKNGRKTEAPVRDAKPHRKLRPLRLPANPIRLSGFAVNDAVPFPQAETDNPPPFVFGFKLRHGENGKSNAAEVLRE